MPDLPHWWWFLILALASWRVFRLLAEDTILDRPRRWLLRLGDWQEEDGEEALPEAYREKWGIFLTCPYCAGFWISGIALTLYSLLIEWHGLLEFMAVWFALSALVALLAKTDAILVARAEILEEEVARIERRR